MFYRYVDTYSGSFLDAVKVKYLVMEKIPFGALDCRTLYVSPLKPPFTLVWGEERSLGFFTDFPRCRRRLSEYRETADLPFSSVLSLGSWRGAGFCSEPRSALHPVVVAGSVAARLPAPTSSYRHHVIYPPRAWPQLSETSNKSTVKREE